MESIYNSQPLDNINDKIFNIVVSTYRYNLTIEYVKGKENEIAGYWSSESSKNGPWIKGDFGKEVFVETDISVIQAINKYKDSNKPYPLMEEMQDAGAMDNHTCQSSRLSKKTGTNPGFKGLHTICAWTT